MSNPLERAKELFTTYDGNTFRMYREGVLEEYKGYDISEEIEMGWFNEMVDQYTRELSIRDWAAVDRLDLIAANYQDERIIRNVMTFASRNVLSSDSIVKLMYAEKMIEIIMKFKTISADLKLEAYKIIYTILEDVINRPLEIDTGHELENYSLKDKRSLNERAKRSIERIKSDLG